MSSPLRDQLISVFVAGALLAWLAYSGLRHGRRQRALAAAHDLPRPPRQRIHPLLLAIAIVGVATVLAGYFGLAASVGERAFGLIIAGLLLAVAFPVFFLQQRRAHDPVVLRAFSLARAGRRADAVALIESALATVAPTATRCWALGRFLSEDGRRSEAERLFARAAELDPANPNYPINRSIALCKLARPIDALAVVTAARIAHAHEAALPAAAFLALFDLSRDDEAREQLRQAEELLCAFPEVQLTGFANPLLQLCRSRLDPSTHAFPVQTPPTP